MSDLIFDVGMHRCEDTDYYLARGCRVVAIDADPHLIERAREEHAAAVAEGQLQLVHAALGADEGTVSFYRSAKTVWSSLRPSISGRQDIDVETIRVPMRTLANLMTEYGTPHYCKVDIEGYDAICLGTLVGRSDLPSFVSTESECLGEGETANEEQALETLEVLRSLGYSRFKLVDQRSLIVIPANRSFYRFHPSLHERAMKRLRLADYGYWGYDAAVREHPDKVRRRLDYTFPPSSSGPFGDDLDGRWVDYATAKSMLLRHRKDFFALPNTKNFDFWCDWHAAC